MLKKSASSVLASLKDSTYRSVRLIFSLAAALPVERRVSARRGWAGENNGLFEHPELLPEVTPYGPFAQCCCQQQTFSAKGSAPSVQEEISTGIAGCFNPFED
jgi:hypothetical protein